MKILRITNEVELTKEEERVTKMKALELFDTNKTNEFEVGTTKGLCDIHRFLFSDIYSFAGEIREENLSKGNGRSTRIWLDMILKNKIGKVIDWSKIDKEEYLLAMERSPIKDTEIMILLKEALTDKINDRIVYMNGIDSSYKYEGYSTYTMKELDK